MLGALVVFQKNSPFVMGHIEGPILCQKYLMNLKIKKYIYVIANKLQTLHTVMGHTINFNTMKRLLLLLSIPILSFGQREIITKKAQEVNNIFLLTDNRDTSPIDNRFEIFDIGGSSEEFFGFDPLSLIFVDTDPEEFINIVNIISLLIEIKTEALMNQSKILGSVAITPNLKFFGGYYFDQNYKNGDMQDLPIFGFKANL